MLNTKALSDTCHTTECVNSDTNARASYAGAHVREALVSGRGAWPPCQNPIKGNKCFYIFSNCQVLQNAKEMFSVAVCVEANGLLV